MSPEQFLDWLNQEIEKCKTLIQKKELGDDVRTWQYGRLNGLWDAKNRFAMFIALSQHPESQTLTPPPTTEVEYWMATPWVKMAMEYAGFNMGDRPGELNWNRKDPELVGQFYCYMLEFLHKNYDITPNK